jgi:hypothetical protein
MTCFNPNTLEKNDLSVFNNDYNGEWIKSREYENRYLCAGQVRYHMYDGKVDNTGLNGLSLQFCNYEYDSFDYDTVTEGLLGDWLRPVVAPSGFYACGMELRNQAYQGDKDDTELNAIKLIFCSLTSWNDKIVEQLNKGLYGEWDTFLCPQDTYVYGISAKVVPSKGDGDDTAMNGISLKCKSPRSNSETSIVSKDLSSEGTWTEMLKNDQFICGGQVRFDPTNRDQGDATALNGIRVKFCTYTITDELILEEGKQGSWLDPIDIPTNTFACGVTLKYSQDPSPKGNYPIDAIKLIYCGSDWNTQGEKNLNDGVKGRWKKSVLCPKDTYIYSARAKIEPINGPFGDEFVLSGIEFKCNGIVSKYGISYIILADDGGWGTWREWVEVENKCVCGGAAKFDSNGTGVFGVKLSFCKVPF